LPIDTDVDDLGSYTEEYSTTILSASTNYQLARAPWPSPVNKKIVLQKIWITSQTPSSLGAQLVIWDQDLSNSTPPTRGSAGGATLILGAQGGSVSGVSAATMLISETQNTEKEFIGGFAMQSSIVNVNVSATFKIV
jgi:hypothetical protein